MIAGGAHAWADSYDQRFLDGLRQRQLFALAEKSCRDRLAHGDLTDEKRAELTIELSRTLTEEALQSPPEERDALWVQALATIDDFAKEYPQNPRLVLARVQRGLVQLAWENCSPRRSTRATDARSASQPPATICAKRSRSCAKGPTRRPSYSDGSKRRASRRRASYPTPSCARSNEIPTIKSPAPAQPG